MAEYHVGISDITNTIYAGTMLKYGEWKDKSNVTDEAVYAVAQYLCSEEREIPFIYEANGKRYKLCVVEVDKNRP